MKNTPLQSVLDDSFDRMFVIDKRGKMVFFPWGDNKQGYLLKSRNVVARVKKFYRSSFFISIVIFLIAASVLHNAWGIIGSMFFCFGGWYFVYYLYISRIVKSLPVAKISYNEIVLEKLEPQGAEESISSDIQSSTQRNRPVHQTIGDVFARIQHTWYRLSPGSLFMVCVFIGIFTVLIWSTYRPERWIDADYLIGFFVCLIVGYGGFVVNQNMESTKADWYVYKRLKLSMRVTMIGCWIFALWFLYEFVVLIFIQR